MSASAERKAHGRSDGRGDQQAEDQSDASGVRDQPGQPRGKGGGRCLATSHEAELPPLPGCESRALTLLAGCETSETSHMRE